MTDNKVTVNGLLSQIDEFEKTIATLQGNVKKLRDLVTENNKKYGPNPDKWPIKE